MTTPSSPVDSIAKAMEALEASRRSMKVCADVVPAQDPNGEYIAAEDAKRIVLDLARQAEAMKREMAELREALDLIADIDAKPFRCAVIARTALAAEERT